MSVHCSQVNCGPHNYLKYTVGSQSSDPQSMVEESSCVSIQLQWAASKPPPPTTLTMFQQKSATCVLHFSVLTYVDLRFPVGYWRSFLHVFTFTFIFSKAFKLHNRFLIALIPIISCKVPVTLGVFSLSIHIFLGLLCIIQYLKCIHHCGLLAPDFIPNILFSYLSPSYCDRLSFIFGKD